MFAEIDTDSEAQRLMRRIDRFERLIANLDEDTVRHYLALALAARDIPELATTKRATGRHVAQIESLRDWAVLQLESAKAETESRFHSFVSETVQDMQGHYEGVLRGAAENSKLRRKKIAKPANEKRRQRGEDTRRKVFTERDRLLKINPHLSGVHLHAAIAKVVPVTELRVRDILAGK
jgi:hypothetical protein